MSLLVDISQEHSRLSSLGYTPILIMANPKTAERLAHEREMVFGDSEGKLLGMEVMQGTLPDGVFRLMLKYEARKDYGDW